jgi:hypothetical protein
MPPMPQRRRGGLARPLLNAGKAASKRLWKLAARKFDLTHQLAEGVIDMPGRRYTLHYGSYAVRYTGPADADMTETVPTPLWLLDLLVGVTEAEDTGTESVRATTCRRIRVKADLRRASQAAPGGMAVPHVGRFEDLLALTTDVWLDNAHVRRLSFATETQTDTLELWDFGAPLDDLDKASP